jgi:hypothetical protein
VILASTIAVTVAVGPLNFAGANPKVSCTAPAAHMTPPPPEPAASAPSRAHHGPTAASFAVSPSRRQVTGWPGSSRAAGEHIRGAADDIGG